MIIKYVLYCFFVIVLFLSLLLPIEAHSGRTDAYGCHNCYTSYCYGEYHCHNGGYSYDYSPPVVYKFPEMTAEWEWIPNYSTKTFTMRVTLNDSNPSEYSAVLNKCIGCDPGPLTDFNTNHFIFYNVSPGRQFLNVKKSISGYWSTISYWTIDVPDWYMPSPTSTPIPTITPTPTSIPFTSYIPNFEDLIFPVFSFGFVGYFIYQVFKK